MNCRNEGTRHLDNFMKKRKDRNRLLGSLSRRSGTTFKYRDFGLGQTGGPRTSIGTIIRGKGVMKVFDCRLFLSEPLHTTVKPLLVNFSVLSLLNFY